MNVPQSQLMEKVPRLKNGGELIQRQLNPAGPVNNCMKKALTI